MAGNAGKGRRKGALNKNTKQIKDMILGALSNLGGQRYLAEQAQENPAAFMTLLGKVLPMQVTGADGGPIEISRIECVIIDPPHRGS